MRDTYNPKSCDDGNSCTVDRCLPTKGCQHTPMDCQHNCLDKCNQSVCRNGTCVMERVNCDDNNPATCDSCDKLLGCRHTSCDDANMCTNDLCINNINGTCTHLPISCDDSKPATCDTCDKKLGCRHTSCDDANMCTIDMCTNNLNGTCSHTPINCDDNNKFTIDSCSLDTGLCVYYPNETAIEIDRMTNNADPTQSYANGQGLSDGFISLLQGFEVQAVNYNGEVLNKSGLNFTILITDASSSNITLPVTMTYLSNGTYSFTYVPLQLGNFVILITLDGVPIKNSTYSINIEGADKSTSAAYGLEQNQMVTTFQQTNFTIVWRNKIGAVLAIGQDNFNEQLLKT
ncbi:hypothetical protein SAMD00019534_091440 [Acytostelium subglobosum LB1]|uniref:hypothetical protein n=1 Tax=Acytostelium subglobosum LB1 TaxID=1410327 RepID=UPI000644F0AB|nr:hypothetical protein SAMD00019534_091440 [Acytostelium subglobosum LB1]GAM25969.1 hypothetical protein SAMD00019534_091440 [Acytostelium subglobosum LB1]|eukprot:XP_012751012.1 hypothetical protein SAMD00019534_091440 [Acytostelium subglobosum LB1]